MKQDATILVTGATGIVGGAVLRLLEESGDYTLLAPTRRDLDMRDQASVFDFFARHRPTYAILLAAKVGGIAANIADPVGFIDDNLRIVLNLFAACKEFKTEKNVYLGSSCVYPRACPQPMKEESLLDGPPEPTNEGYALAKIVGVKLAQYYFSQWGLNTVCPIPCNIYGTGDHFSFERAHVLSALVRRFVDAKDENAPSVTLWGTGTARREFIHVNDVARAILYFLEHVDTPSPVNVGPGTDVSIRELAQLIAEQVGYQGHVHWDPAMPDGMPRKCMDVERMRRLGFSPHISLEDGISRTVGEYKSLKETGSVLS